MQNELVSHREASNLRVTTTVYLNQKSIALSFVIKGKLDEYSFSPQSKQTRANELWKATCFELFLANSNNEAYYEFNFSPSLAWNFYYLNEYRAEPCEVEMNTEPKIETLYGQDSFQIFCELEINTRSFDSYNVAAILLTKEAQRTFWSVNHLNTAPDFHHRANFLKIK